jgi:sulfur transfer complex TusBCD TusB component (DsrH family)
MRTVLHLVKSAGTGHPWDLLSQPALRNERASVVLIQDAVTADPALPVPTFALAADAARRGVSPSCPLIDDERLLDLIWEAETVVVW